MTRDELLRSSRRELLEIIRNGYPIAPEALDNLGYRGISLGLPAFVERLSWKTFQKTFYRDPATGLLRGWNVRAEQRGLDALTAPKQKRGRPWTFGHYQVISAAHARLPRIGRTRGLLIDYGLGGNHPLDPMSRLRDPIVAVREGSAELLLGWSFVDLGLFSLGTPSFFALEREGPLSHFAEPRSAR